ncbi:flocculation protein FLO11 isoform X3 [Aplysia californica]|uniref:Flocculation protein FLO11 isoform X3 n=1 Tax=Aplysia californica TaxID=6500 RepID=A0ABM1VVQ2_APLCA|nr:flocculation protein FLO11 isoform X3 [Aplysia californica]
MDEDDEYFYCSEFDSASGMKSHEEVRKDGNLTVNSAQEQSNTEDREDSDNAEVEANEETPNCDGDTPPHITEWMLETFTFMTAMRKCNGSLVQSLTSMISRIESLEAEKEMLRNQLVFPSMLSKQVDKISEEMGDLRTVMETVGQKVDELDARQGVVNDGENDVSVGPALARLSLAVEALDVEVEQLQSKVDSSPVQPPSSEDSQLHESSTANPFECATSLPQPPIVPTGSFFSTSSDGRANEPQFTFSSSAAELRPANQNSDRNENKTSVLSPRLPGEKNSQGPVQAPDLSCLPDPSFAKNKDGFLQAADVEKIIMKKKHSQYCFQDYLDVRSCDTTIWSGTNFYFLVILEDEEDEVEASPTGKLKGERLHCISGHEMYKNFSLEELHFGDYLLGWNHQRGLSKDSTSTPWKIEPATVAGSSSCALAGSAEDNAVKETVRPDTTAVISTGSEYVIEKPVTSSTTSEFRLGKSVFSTSSESCNGQSVFSTSSESLFQKTVTTSTASGSLFEKTVTASTTSGSTIGNAVTTSTTSGSLSGKPVTASTTSGSLSGKPVTASTTSGSLSGKPVTASTTSGSLSGKPVTASTTSGSLSGKPVTASTTSGSLSGKPVTASTTSGSTIENAVTASTTSGSLSGKPVTAYTTSGSTIENAVTTSTTSGLLFEKPVTASTTSGSTIGNAVTTSTTSGSLSGKPVTASTTSGSLSGKPVTASTTSGSLSGKPVTASTTSGSLSGKPVTAYTTSGSTIENAVTTSTTSGLLFEKPVTASTTSGSTIGNAVTTSTTSGSLSGKPVTASTTSGSLSGKPVTASTTSGSLSGKPVTASTTSGSLSGKPVTASTTSGSLSGKPVTASTTSGSLSGKPVTASTTSGSTIENAVTASTTSGSTIENAVTASTTSGSLSGKPVTASTTSGSLSGCNYI